MIEVLEDSICLELDKVKADGDETAVSLLAYGDNKLHEEDDDDETMDLGNCNPGMMNRSTVESATIQGMALGEATTRMVELGASTPLSSSPTSGSDFSQQMRTAAVMLAQLQRQDANDPTQERVHVIRQRVIDQMVALEEQRLAASPTTPLYDTMVSVDKQIGNGPADGKLAVLPDDPRVMMMNKDDPSGK
jgi:phosphatidylinositol 4-kinase